MKHPLTTREFAELYRYKTWQVQRVFEDGNLPEPPRFGNRRVIALEMVPKIIDALRARGWLPAEAPTDQPLAKVPPPAEPPTAAPAEPPEVQTA